MNALTLAPHLKQRLDHLTDVMAVYLFGSRATGREHPLADYDYGILTCSTGHRKGDEFYFELYDLLSDISPRSFQNDVIDIAFVRDVGLELRAHIVRYGKLLYDRNPEARLEFESQTTLLYCDYRPILLEMDQAILEAL
ncbi:MAG: nucleotidyltransferase domain-containing protein [Deltaproteobacteria bacterium]|nr:nucleotidyltransferase domain-containing protein [Deltaproteobacteria bacterium]